MNKRSAAAEMIISQIESELTLAQAEEVKSYLSGRLGPTGPSIVREMMTERREATEDLEERIIAVLGTKDSTLGRLESALNANRNDILKILEDGEGDKFIPGKKGWWSLIPQPNAEPQATEQA